MTDSPSLFTTTSLPNPFPVTAIPAQQSPLLNGTTSDTNLQEEEEYTIKCICGYIDDDGNTVYCPKCDTWQHIECYYPSRKVPEDHYCTDCVPRADLDAKRANERQKRHREALDGGDRKIKRPPTAKTKKKHKESISTTEQMNGWHLHDRHDSLTNGRDQPPPAKKPKTNHRTSGSVTSINGTESRKRATSNAQGYPSPSKSPQEQSRYPPIPAYSQDFLDLYDRDDGSVTAQANEPTVQAMGKLSSWRNDPSLIIEAGQQPHNHAPFVRAPQSLDVVAYPTVSVETVEKKEVDIDGKSPTWKYIRTQTPISKDEIVGEIRGEVGLLQEYCRQESTQNRWNELRHPDPFVFFHPHMDIYIDSRKEGTQLRYLRRSCAPNVTLKTFVSEDGDIRHCFVARENIAPGKELTAAWFLDPDMMLSGHLNGEQDDPPFSRQSNWVSRVLSNFGDCACTPATSCYFAKFDCRVQPKPADMLEKPKVGRKKKLPKSKPAISPLSTGQATNSRAGSEALKQEDDDQQERRSTSGSSASDPKSRDMTPSNIAALDADPVLGNDLTAREIRKIKAMEKLFELGGSAKKDMKKKRTSAGSTLNTPNAQASRHSPHYLTPTPLAAEQFSGSPPPRLPHQKSGKRKASQQLPVRPTYTSIAIQTEPEECELDLAPPPKRKKFMTPTQKLLRKVQADRHKWEQEAKDNPASQQIPVVSTSYIPPMLQDVEMKDAGAGSSPMSTRSLPLASPSTVSDTNTGPSPARSPIYPLPSQAAHSHKQFKIPPPPKLQLSTLPPVPTFSSGPSMPSTSTDTTPAAVATPISQAMQSPVMLQSTLAPQPSFTPNAVTPSPAKKKLSLGDYISRRNTNSASTPAAEKVPGQTTPERIRKDSVGSVNGVDAAPSMKPHDSVKEEAETRGGLQGIAVQDSVMSDEVDEPPYSPRASTPHRESSPINGSSNDPNPVDSAAVPPAPSLSKETSAELTNIMQVLKQWER